MLCGLVFSKISCLYCKTSLQSSKGVEASISFRPILVLVWAMTRKTYTDQDDHVAISRNAYLQFMVSSVVSLPEFKYVPLGKPPTHTLWRGIQRWRTFIILCQCIRSWNRFFFKTAYTSLPRNCWGKNCMRLM